LKQFKAHVKLVYDFVNQRIN